MRGWSVVAIRLTIGWCQSGRRSSGFTASNCVAETNRDERDVGLAADETNRDVWLAGNVLARPPGECSTCGITFRGRRSATPIVHHQSMPPTLNRRLVDPTPRPRPTYGCGPKVEEWWCPVCSAPVHRVAHMPGRPRIYCTNTCRQRAYRWRRDHHARLAATPEHPAERASVGVRGHALRSSRDFVSQYSDSRGREVTVCGAMGRPARLA